VYDTVKATVVMINLGNAVYRDNSFGFGVDPRRGHSAIVYKYEGTCNPTEFSNSDKFYVIEMQGPTDDKTLTTMLGYGCYTNVSDITYSKRLSIIKTAKALVARGVDYEAVNAVWPGNWDGTIENITDLRCDGLVEVCYETSGVDVWAMKREYNGTSYNYDIADQVDIFGYDNRVWAAGANSNNDNLEEHNDFDVGEPSDWNDTLQPSTQCGHIPPVNAATKLSLQNLCNPIGHRGY